MAPSINLGKFQFDLAPDPSARRRDPEGPFRLLILADLSGRASRGAQLPLHGRKPAKIDVDTFESIQARSGVLIRLTGPEMPGGRLELPVAAMEQFHPDHLLKHVYLAELVELRKRLMNPSTSAPAIAEAQELFQRPVPGASSDTSSPSESSQDMLARLMGQPAASGSTSAPTSPTTAEGSIEALIRNIVAPSIVAGQTAEQGVYQKGIEDEMTRRLRTILHHPEWQRIEANWRGVEMMVQEFGGEENLEIYVLDVSREELEADLCSVADLSACGLYRALREQSWAVALVAGTFGASLADFEVLGRLARVGQGLRVPVLAGANDQLAGTPSLAARPDPDDWQSPLIGETLEAWNALRERDEARFLGLALPRMLMRLPYGRGHDEIDAFGFEELLPSNPHDSFLWGASSFACGHVLADAFRAGGWPMSFAGAGEVTGRPVYRFVEDGTTRVQPCAEALLSDRAAQRIQDAGLIAVQSVKGRDSIRVAGLRSISSKDGTLAGGQ